MNDFVGERARRTAVERPARAELALAAEQQQLLRSEKLAAVGQLTTDDLRAVWAYLRAQPAVSNAVPALLPPPARP